MLVAEEFVGTLDDGDVASRVENSSHLTITVDDVERRRSRFRTTAENGAEIGVVVARELQDGDVLEADGTLVVVSLAPVDAMVLEFGDVAAPATGAVTGALALGHAVGNRHWDLVVEGTRAYLPLAESRDRMEATISPHLPDGARIEYESVQPTRFGGDTADGHSVEDDHTHSPDRRTLDSDGGEQP